MSISEAFLTICEKAIPAESFFVSLYIQSPYYGGPEEGGWWGSDTSLVAYHEYDTEAGADFAKAQVDALVEDMNKKAKLEFGNHCLKQTEWLEARGLDDSYLPEVDGEESYYVTRERRPGEDAARGCRHYE